MRFYKKRALYHRSSHLSGFTLPELLVSLVVIALISLAVTADLSRSRLNEELQSSARVLAGQLRDFQAAALSVKAVQTCATSGGVRQVCEVDTTGCASACNIPVPPHAYGVYMQTGQGLVNLFAEVDNTLLNRRIDNAGRESMGTRPFVGSRIGQAPRIHIQSLTVNGSSASNATVTFERQSGSLRINACGTPLLAPSCGASPEPTTLEIVLVQTANGDTKTLRLNAITGKISIE